jgi:hypothetical protein
MGGCSRNSAEPSKELEPDQTSSIPARIEPIERIKIKRFIMGAFAIMLASQFSLPIPDSFVITAFLGFATSEKDPVEGSCVPGAHIENVGRLPGFQVRLLIFELAEGL